MPKVVDPEAQRDEVLDATLRTIVRLGIAGTTMREIAEEGKVSTGFITHWFPDKNAVLVAALRRSNDRRADRMQEHLDGQHGLDALGAVIEATLPLTEDGRLGWMVWLSFWGSTPGNPDLREEQRAGYRAWRSLIVHHLHEAQAAGEIDEGRDVEYEADRLIALVVGIGVQSAMLGVGRQVRQAKSFIDDHLTELRERM